MARRKRINYATKAAKYLQEVRNFNGTEKMPKRKTEVNKIALTAKVIGTSPNSRGNYYNSFWQRSVKHGRIVMDNGIPRVTKQGMQYIRANTL
jgi:hypothetical protein